MQTQEIVKQKDYGKVVHVFYSDKEKMKEMHCPTAQNMCRVERCMDWDNEVGCLRRQELLYFKTAVNETKEV